MFTEFPAITVCLDNFGDLQWFNGSLLQRCNSEVDVSRFIDTLKHCLENDEDETSTTEGNTIFGGLFDQNDTTQKFTSVNELLNATKFIQIQDMINVFYFGNNLVHIDKFIDFKEREMFLQQNWIPTLHYKSGFCYTYQHSEQRMKLVPIHYFEKASGERLMTELELGFEVFDVHPDYYKFRESACNSIAVPKGKGSLEGQL